MSPRRATLVSVTFLAAWLLSPMALSLDEPRSEWVGCADAAISIAYSLEQLVDESDRAVVVVPTERRHQWEEVAGSRRIVTYTRIEVRDTVFKRTQARRGAPPPEKKTLWVRTLGGQVGRIGQHVGGEAQLQIGEENLLFLTLSKHGALVVTGMAQGQYPIARAKTGGPKADPNQPPPKARLQLSRSMGTILPRRKRGLPALKQLVGIELHEAIRRIREVKRARDAAKKAP